MTTKKILKEKNFKKEKKNVRGENVIKLYNKIKRLNWGIKILKKEKTDVKGKNKIKYTNIKKTNNIYNKTQ